MMSQPLYAAILPRLSWLEISDAQVGIVEKFRPFPYQDLISLNTPERHEEVPHYIPGP
jgi:hypothetical protein